MRIVKTRDSATSILRKLGVNSRDYNLFIEKNPDGSLLVKEGEARKHVAGEVIVDLVASKDMTLQPATEKKPVPLAHTTSVEKVIGKERRLTISSLAEELLLAGKSNAEVWAALKERFKLGDDKKHYPSWFRSRLRRTGKLPKKEKKS